MVQLRLFNESAHFIVRSGTGSVTYSNPVRFTDQICIANRVPVEHSGWQAVRYKNKWYQLFGGIRTPLFICLNSPIKNA